MLCRSVEIAWLVRVVGSYCLIVVKIVDQFFSKVRCVCRVVSRSGTFRLPVSGVC